MTEINEKLIPFEEAFARLQKIVEKLENETVDLEQALLLFKEGRNLVSICNHHLEKAELRIKNIDEPEQEKTDAV